MIAVIALFAPAPLLAAEAGAPHLDGAALGLAWVLPFAGILLSIAVLPMLAPTFWHRHFGKVSAFWAAAFLIPFITAFGLPLTLHEVLHTAFLEYLPFILLLFTLFVVAGGIRVVGGFAGTPATNAGILAFGTMIASLIGTTGAAMILLRLLIEANQNRRRNLHVFIFFIFLVANIGGALTPLGDPPLFLGFLQGVDFTWTLYALFAPMLLCSAVLLAAFYVIDRGIWRRDGGATASPSPQQLRLEGSHNLLLLAAVVGAVLLSGVWRPEIALAALGVAVPLEGLVRDVLLVLLAWLSWRTTPASVRIENAFTWEPIQEVALLFAGIFVTIIPALAILKAGSGGVLAGIMALVQSPGGRADDVAYFWLTGVLSSFLDNAPTYLVFFNVAGGDSATLMGPEARTLLAISAGSVFFGALTYIGNAPNFMVKSICEEHGIRMPSFLGYMAWSCAILLPLFAVVTLIFFWR